MINKWTLNIIALLVVTALSSGLEAKIIHDEIAVCEHKGVRLTCNGAPNARHRWKMRTGNSPRKRIPDNPTKYEFQNNSLVVKNIQKADTYSKFFCYTSSVHRYRITYIYSLKINCDNIRSFVGAPVILACDVDIPDNDIGKVHWKFRSKHSGRLIKISSKMHDGRIAFDRKSRTLTIRKVKIEDSGSYICIVHRVKNINLSKGKFTHHLHVDKAITTKKPLTMDTTSMAIKVTTTTPLTTNQFPSSTSPYTKKTNITSTSQPQIVSHTSSTTKSSTSSYTKKTNIISTSQPQIVSQTSSTTKSSTSPYTKKTNIRSTTSQPQIASQKSSTTKSTTLKTMLSSTLTTTKRPTKIVNTENFSKTLTKVTTNTGAHSRGAVTPTRTLNDKTTWKIITEVITQSTKAKTNAERPTRRDLTTWHPENDAKSKDKTNGFDFDNDNQKMGVVTTKPYNSSGTTLASVFVSVGFCLLVLFFLLYEL